MKESIMYGMGRPVKSNTSIGRDFFLVYYMYSGFGVRYHPPSWHDCRSIYKNSVCGSEHSTVVFFCSLHIIRHEYFRRKHLSSALPTESKQISNIVNSLTSTHLDSKMSQGR